MAAENTILNDLTKKRNELQAEIDSLIVERKKLDRAILALSGDVQPNKWSSDAIGCLTRNDRLMKTAEVLECLYYDRLSELRDGNRRRILLAALSTALNNLCDQKILARMGMPGEKGFYYGLAEWFEDDLVTLKEKYIEEKFKHTA